MIDGNKPTPMVQLDLDRDHLVSLDRSLLNVAVLHKNMWKFRP